MKQFIYIIVLLFALNIQAQDPETGDPKYVIFLGDTIFREVIELEDVIVFDNLRFASHEERVRYYILRRRVLKVYPYAKLAADRLTEMNRVLDSLPKKSQKRKYTRRIQNYIEDEFTEELKKLTRTEGQILVKLIHRQTGETTFSLVKEYRSGWRAFWYNNTARMFNISLKKEYDPVNVQEDYVIEDILQRAFAAKILPKQASALKFDFLSLTNKWKTKTEDEKKL